MSDVQKYILAAVKQHGSQGKLAARMGCSQQLVSYLMTADRISAEMAIKLDDATDGAAPKHVLRPDIFDAPEGE